MVELRVVTAVRFLMSLALVALLGVAVSAVGVRRSPVFDAASCSGPSLSAAFTGALRVSDVQSYGCEDDWAYLWATVGRGQVAVGVTEVLHFEVRSNVWRVSSRLKVCMPGVMPTFIYRQGCFSN